MSQFVFTPGPVDWPEGKSLLLGEINDVKLRVTRYLAHARPSEEWMADPDGNGIAAMKFSLVGPDNTENAEQWLTATRFGGSAAVGSAKVEFQQAEADTMVDDFISPPAKEDLDPQGLLTIHYEGRVTARARQQEHRQEDPARPAATFPSRSPHTCPMPGSRPTAGS